MLRCFRFFIKPLLFLSVVFILLSGFLPIVTMYPLALGLLILCAFVSQKKGTTEAGKVLLLSLAAAGLSATFGASIAKIASQFDPNVVTGPGSVEAWFSILPLSYWGDQFGRIGLLVGAALGLFWSPKRSLNRQHNANMVHGLPVAGANPEKGTNRWAGDNDLRNVAEFGPPKEQKFGGGTIIGKLDNRIVRLQPEKCTPPLPQHCAVAAGTGAGKTFSFVIPNIVSAAVEGESIVVTDPKGELTCLMARWLESKGYKVQVFNLAYPQWSAYWNPLLECKDDEEISAFATAIIQNAAKDGSGYFVMKEIQLLKAMVSLLIVDFPAEQAHLRSVLSLLSWDAEVLDNRFKAAFASGKLSQTAFEEWRGAMSSNLDNAISGVTAKLGIVRAENIAKLLSRQEIDLSSIGKEKTALFCVLPINAGHLKPILASFYYFFFRRLYALAAENGGQLPNNVRFLLDEFANIGQIPGFVEIISTARSLGIKLQFILQGLKQLQDAYGGSEAEAILSNCPIQMFLGGDDATTTRYFSGRLGAAAVWAKAARETKPLSTAAGVLTRQGSMVNVVRKSESRSVVRRALMEPEELSRMDPMNAVALVRWTLPLYLQKCGWPELPQAKEIKEHAVETLADVCPTRSDEPLEIPPFPTNEGLTDNNVPVADADLHELGIF